MTKIMKCHIALDEDERGKAIALSEERKISMSALFRSVLYGKIPKIPNRVKVKAMLKMGEVRNKIEEVMEKIPEEDRREFKELESLLEELRDEIELCP